MNLRQPYSKLSPEAYQGFIAAKDALARGPLGLALIELVNLRVSQINGCAFCTRLHAQALRNGGTADAKLDSLAGWRVSELFDARERAALAWAESLTHIASSNAPDEVYEPLLVHFDAAQISDLTFAVSLMNAFNRLAIGMRQ